MKTETIRIEYRLPAAATSPVAQWQSGGTTTFADDRAHMTRVNEQEMRAKKHLIVRRAH